jgi:hypothetical protein
LNPPLTLQEIEEKANAVIRERDERKDWLERQLLGTLLAKDRTPLDFWDDPALINVLQIDPLWLSTLHDFPQTSPQNKARVLAEYLVMIARNLFAKALPITQENVRAEFLDVLKWRQDYGDTPIFKDRHVILASHLERYEDGKDRFGQRALLDRLRKETGSAGFEHFEAQNNSLDALKKTKAAFLSSIQTAPSPLTLVFDGHGGPEFIYLSDGELPDRDANGPLPVETENTIKISVEELQEAFLMRQQKGVDVSKDIVLIDGCYSHEFVRALLKKCPVVGVAVSEYGQVAYSSYSAKHGNKVFDWMFDPSRRQVLSDFWELTPVSLHNPSVFISVPNSSSTPNSRPSSDSEPNLRIHQLAEANPQNPLVPSGGRAA